MNWPTEHDGNDFSSFSQPTSLEHRRGHRTLDLAHVVVEAAQEHVARLQRRHQRVDVFRGRAAERHPARVALGLGDGALEGHGPQEPRGVDQKLRQGDAPVAVVVDPAEDAFDELALEHLADVAEAELSQRDVVVVRRQRAAAAARERRVDEGVEGASDDERHRAGLVDVDPAVPGGVVAPERLVALARPIQKFHRVAEAVVEVELDGVLARVLLVDAPHDAEQQALEVVGRDELAVEVGRRDDALEGLARQLDALHGALRGFKRDAAPPVAGLAVEGVKRVAEGVAGEVADARRVRE